MFGLSAARPRTFWRRRRPGCVRASWRRRCGAVRRAGSFRSVARVHPWTGPGLPGVAGRGDGGCDAASDNESQGSDAVRGTCSSTAAGVFRGWSAGAVTHPGDAKLPAPGGPAGRGGVADLESLGSPAKRPAVVHGTAGRTKTSGLGQRGVTVGHEGLLVSVRISQSTSSQQALTQFKHPPRVSPTSRDNTPTCLGS